MRPFAAVMFGCLLSLFTSCSDSSASKNDNTVPADTDTGVTDEIVDDTAVGTDNDTLIVTDDDGTPIVDDAPITEPDECCADGDGLLPDEDTLLPDEDTLDPLLAQFVGTWAERLILVSDTKTIIGNVRSTTTRYKLGKVTAEGGELRIENKICKIDNTTSQGDTIFYQKFCDIYWFWHPSELSDPKPDITVTDNSGTVTFIENRSWELRGMQKMPNVETDLMPTDDDDPRIFDHDDDGHPGFTLGFTSARIKGDMYIVQRLSHELTGTYFPGDGIYNGSNDPDRIEGGVNWTDSQYTIDATNPTLNSQKESTIINDESFFRYIRVVDTFDCDMVYGQKDLLFAD